MSLEDLMIRVNGAQLQAHVDKQVILLGKGTQSGNMSLKVESCDGQIIEVKLLAQPDGNVCCPLEVIGTVTGARSIKAREVILHPEWEGVFDMETYSSALETIHSDSNLQQYVLGMN